MLLVSSICSVFKRVLSYMYKHKLVVSFQNMSAHVFSGAFLLCCATEQDVTLIISQPSETSVKTHVLML